MKTFFNLSGQIVAILLAALVVVGITMSVVDTSSTPQFSPDGSNVSAVSGQSGESGRPSGEFHGPTDQSVASRVAFSLFGILQNVGIIGVIVLVVNWLERRFFLQPAKVTR